MYFVFGNSMIHLLCFLFLMVSLPLIFTSAVEIDVFKENDDYTNTFDNSFIGFFDYL